jgi:DNA polymerase-3 subunit epsilon
LNKLLWIDCETGGTEEKTDALLQLSAIIEINNEVVDTIDLKMKPFGKKVVTPEALKVQGRTMQDIAAFEDPRACYDRFYKFLQREPKSKTNRFIVAGYLAEFDLRFVKAWFDDLSGGPYAFWDYLQFSPIDVLPTLRAMRYAGIINEPDTKLETMCKHFGIEIKAHDSMSDIAATRELTKLVFGKLFSGWTGKECPLILPNE